MINTDWFSWNKICDFVTMVEEMRRLQREYFRTRQSGVLQEAKQAERKVDQMIADFLKVKTQEQGRLC